MKRKRQSLIRRSSPPSLFPKGKKERRRMELLGGSAFAMVVGVIVVVFFVAGAGRILFGLPQTAAVITSILVDLANGGILGLIDIPILDFYFPVLP